MNIYERELARELGRRGLRVDIFTRRQDPESLAVIPWEANVRVIPISAGPEAPVPKEDVYRLLPQFLRGVMQFREATGEDYDLMHSHYWLSGWVGQALQGLWRVPHVTMFHSLGEAKNRARVSEHEPRYRIEAERQIAQSADRVICASQDEKEMLHAALRRPRREHRGGALRRGPGGASGRWTRRRCAAAWASPRSPSSCSWGASSP